MDSSYLRLRRFVKCERYLGKYKHLQTLLWCMAFVQIALVLISAYERAKKMSLSLVDCHVNFTCTAKQKPEGRHGILD